METTIPVRASNSSAVFVCNADNYVCKRGRGNEQVTVFLCTCKCGFFLRRDVVSTKCFAKDFHMIWLESKKCQTSHCKLGFQPSFVLRSDPHDF